MSFRQGDIGKDVNVTIMADLVGKDISGASVMQIILKPPKGPSKRFTASFVTDGVDGKMKYTLEADDLHQFGTWKIQARIVDGGLDARTAEADFPVTRKLD